jgi:acetyl-CoA synthetase
MELTAELLIEHGATAAEAPALARAITRALAQPDALAAWRELARGVLTPALPFALHKLVHGLCFASWDAARGPAPAWVPSDEEIAASNLGQEMAGDYAAFQRLSCADPEAFWGAMPLRLGVHFDAAPERILDTSGGVEDARWFPGARLNIVASALGGPDDRPAVVVGRDGAVVARYTVGDLRRRVAEVRAGLAAMGLGAGDAVAVDMPMGYEAVAIYLAIIAAGAVAVCVADSFAPAEIEVRLRIAKTKAIFTQDVIDRGGKRLPLYERVIAAGAPRAVVLAAGAALALPLREGDLGYDAFLAAGAGAADRLEPRFVSCDASAATAVLFSSGTTGEPKALVWTHLTPIKAAADGWAHQDIRPGDLVAWPTNLGWMMGAWLIYASLLNGAALALYDGSPLERGFCELVAAARVTMLGVVPSLVREWRLAGAMDGLDLSALRCFSSTGEASNADDMLWLMSRAGYKPVIEYCGGTELGGGYITGTVVQPQAPATFSTPAIGCDFVIIDDDGGAIDNGELALIAPIFGSSDRLIDRDHHAVYFAGMPRGPKGEVLRRHGDQIERLGGGYFRAHGRVDDTMNLGGIKTSSAAIERVCNKVAGVVETAAIAASPPGGGPSLLVVYAVAPGADRAALADALGRAIKRDLNPLFKLHDVVVVEALPRTASNKVMRRVLRDRYQREAAAAT